MFRVSFSLLFFLHVTSFVFSQSNESANEVGSFLIHRRQFLIGEEKYSITKTDDQFFIESTINETERSKNNSIIGELHLNNDLTPTRYQLGAELEQRSNYPSSKQLTIQIKNKQAIITQKNKVVTKSADGIFFIAHSSMPAVMEMMLMRYWLNHNLENKLKVLPLGEVSITYRGKDLVQINEKNILLDRYIVSGITWGIQTIWMNSDKQLIALVKSGTQLNEIILKGYESKLLFFVEKAAEEQMTLLTAFTKKLRTQRTEILALVGGNLINGTGNSIQKDVTIIIKGDKISFIGTRVQTKIPPGAKVINVNGKTLIPGLWDMHAHSNQVDWAPAYLAGGITSIRDCGNEIEFATAFRNAVNSGKAMGPEILLAGMIDGEGVRGNGIIRANTPQEAIKIVNRYKDSGYVQIKIYNSLKPELVKTITAEAHRLGMTVTGHVPRGMNTTEAVKDGMDMINHAMFAFEAIFPAEKSVRNFLKLADVDLASADIKNMIQLFLQQKTVLDPTLSVYELDHHAENISLEKIEPGITKLPLQLTESKGAHAGLTGKSADSANKAMDKALVLIGTLHKAGVPIVAGNDNAAPVHGIYRELELYVKAGFTPMEAIQSATLVPAKVMNRDKETGTIEIGKRADIAILDANPLDNIRNIRSVSAVISKGYYYRSSSLWKSVGFKP